METKNMNDSENRLSDWILRYSKSKPGKFYYHNVKTRESTWTRPEGFVEGSCRSPSKASAISPEKESLKRSSTCLQSTNSKENSNSKNSSLKNEATSNKNFLEDQIKRKKLVAKRSRKDSSVLERTDPNDRTSNALQGNRMRKTINVRRSKTEEGDQAKSVSTAVQIVSNSMRSEEGVDIARNNNNFNTTYKKSKTSQVEENKNSSDEKMTNVKASSRLATKVSPKSVEKRKRRPSNCKVEIVANVGLKETKTGLPKSLEATNHSEVSSKECSKIFKFDQSHILLRSQNINSDSVITSSHTNHSATPAADRLLKLQSSLKSNQETRWDVSTSQHPSVQQYKETCFPIDECEAMDVEYMESEVLTDIGELRHQATGIQWDQQTIFMDMDEDCFDSSNQLEPKQTFYVVLDTNILLSHLSFAERLRDTFIPDKGAVHLYLPWQVLHELDHLKDKGKKSIQPLARRAINYLHQNFSSKHPRVCGQRMSDAAQNSSNCPDDNILEACLLLKRQGFSSVVLLSNDINLLNKALVCDIEALSKSQFTQELCVRSAPISDKSVSSQSSQCVKPHEPVGSESNSFQNDIFLTDLKCILKDLLTEILSKGMEEEYKHLWKKRIIIPPPWSTEQALQCLFHHWMAICGDFIPNVAKSCIKDLKSFLKLKSQCNSITVEDLKKVIELAKALMTSIPKKYKNLLEPAQQYLQTILSKIDGAISPQEEKLSSVSNQISDFKYQPVFMCFKGAYDAAKSLSNSEAVSTSDWRIRAGSMIEALQKLIHLLQLLLLSIPNSLNVENPLVVELVILIKGDHPVTADDLVYFCKEESNINLLRSGVQEFTSLLLHLTNMVQSAPIL